MVTAAQAERAHRRTIAATAAASTEQHLLGSVAQIVRSTVPYTAAAWLVTDPATTLFTDGYIEEFQADTCEPWFTNELLTDDLHKFHELVGRPAGVLSRRLDKTDSQRWSQIMRPQGLDDEVRLTFDDATGCWGTLELHRPVGDADFDPDEVALLERLAPEVTRGLRRLAAHRAATTTTAPNGPGLIVIRDDETVEPMTHAGAAWLELLSETAGNAAPTRTAMLSMAGVVRSAAAGGRLRADTRLRLRADNGEWVTMYAEPTLTGDGVVIVVEPSRPADIAAVLSLAHGLSEREQQVALAIARGRSTAEIAAELFLSPHTVRDHVKSALTKVGVNSRAELVATLFEQHYANDFFGQVAAH